MWKKRLGIAENFSANQKSVYAFRPLRAMGMMLLGCSHGIFLIVIFFVFIGKFGTRADLLVCGAGIILSAIAPSLRLHFNYMKHSKRRTLRFSQDGFTDETNTISREFRFADLERIEVVSSGHIKAPWGIYNYFTLWSRDGSPGILIPCYLMRYYEFVKNPLIQAQLIAINPKVVGIYRFPLI